MSSINSTSLQPVISSGASSGIHTTHELKDDQTRLTDAVARIDWAKIKDLVEHSNDISIDTLYYYHNFPCIQLNLLSIALAHYQRDLFTLILKKYPTIEFHIISSQSKLWFQGLTPLCTASRNSWWDVVEIILRNHPEVNINVRKEGESTVLKNICLSRKKELFDLVLERDQYADITVSCLLPRLAEDGYYNEIIALLHHYIKFDREGKLSQEDLRKIKWISYVSKDTKKDVILKRTLLYYHLLMKDPSDTSLVSPNFKEEQLKFENSFLKAAEYLSGWHKVDEAPTIDLACKMIYSEFPELRPFPEFYLAELLAAKAKTVYIQHYKCKFEKIASSAYHAFIRKNNLLMAGSLQQKRIIHTIVVQLELFPHRVIRNFSKQIIAEIGKEQGTVIPIIKTGIINESIHKVISMPVVEKVKLPIIPLAESSIPSAIYECIPMEASTSSSSIGIREQIIQAARSKNWKIVKELLEATDGAYINMRYQCCTNITCTLLWAAADDRQRDLVAWIVQNFPSADVNAMPLEGNFQGVSVFSQICYNNWTWIMEYILTRNQYTDITARNIDLGWECFDTSLLAPLSRKDMSYSVPQFNLIIKMLRHYLIHNRKGVNTVSDIKEHTHWMRNLFFYETNPKIINELTYYFFLIGMSLNDKLQPEHKEELTKRKQVFDAIFDKVTVYLLSGFYANEEKLYNIPYEIRSSMACQIIYSELEELKSLPEVTLSQILDDRARAHYDRLYNEKIKKIAHLAFSTLIEKNNLLIYSNPHQVKYVTDCIQEQLELYPHEFIKKYYREIINEIGKEQDLPFPLLNIKSINAAIQKVRASSSMQL